METSFKIREHSGIDPTADPAKFVAKHLSAYHFARTFATGSVLELGFGDGYGAYFLSDTAREVLAIDLFEANVQKAVLKYQKNNLTFRQMSATDLQVPDKSLDLVVSFQVIEHIPQPELPKYMKEIKRVLRPGGRVCLSTLNLKKNMKRGRLYNKSPHHDKEFTAQEFYEFITRFFDRVELFGLYPTAKHRVFENLKKSGVGKWLPIALNPIENYYRKMTVTDFKWVRKTDLDDCIDMMALCHG